MSLASLDLLVSQGSDDSFLMTVKDATAVTVDIDGANLYLTVREDADSPTPVIAKTTADAAQILILDQTVLANRGQAKIFFTPADTEDLEAKPYVYDIWIKMDGKQHPLIALSAFTIRERSVIIP